MGAQSKTASKSFCVSPLWLVANVMTRSDARMSSCTGKLNVYSILHPTAAREPMEFLGKSRE